jgi:hypothetical protein
MLPKGKIGEARTGYHMAAVAGIGFARGRRGDQSASIALMEEAENGSPLAVTLPFLASSPAICRSDLLGLLPVPRSRFTSATSSGFFSAHVRRP